MEQLDVKHLEYTEHFTVAVDAQTQSCTVVGQDAEGRLILNTSEEYHIGSAYSTAEKYYLLTPEEYRTYARQACQNGMLTARQCSERMHLMPAETKEFARQAYKSGTISLREYGEILFGK